MRKIDLLRQLQEADSQIDSTRATAARLAGQLGERRALDERAAQLARTREEVRSLEAQQRDLELQAEDRRAKIAADEGKLYGGRVTNPKELSSLSDEVAQDRRQLNVVEDKLLEVLVRAEEASARAAQQETDLAQMTRAWNEAQATTQARLAEGEQSVRALEARRTGVQAQLDQTDLSTYETLRRQKGGLAVAQVQQRTCQACRVSLTAALEQRARIGAELVVCHSCGRILYVALS